MLLNPVRFRDVPRTLLGSVRADKGFGTDEMLALGRAMRGFSPASSEFTTVPLRGTGALVPGIGSTLKWDPVKAGEALPGAARRPSARRAQPARAQGHVVDVSPQQVRVQVDNGTGAPGSGKRVDAGAAGHRLPHHAGPGQLPGAPADQRDGHRLRPALGPLGEVPGDGAARQR